MNRDADRSPHLGAFGFATDGANECEAPRKPSVILRNPVITSASLGWTQHSGKSSNQVPPLSSTPPIAQPTAIRPDVASGGTNFGLYSLYLHQIAAHQQQQQQQTLIPQHPASFGMTEAKLRRSQEMLEPHSQLPCAPPAYLSDDFRTSYALLLEAYMHAAANLQKQSHGTNSLMYSNVTPHTLASLQQHHQSLIMSHQHVVSLQKPLGTSGLVRRTDSSPQLRTIYFNESSTPGAMEQHLIAAPKPVGPSSGGNRWANGSGLKRSRSSIHDLSIVGSSVNKTAWITHYTSMEYNGGGTPSGTTMADLNDHNNNSHAHSNTGGVGKAQISTSQCSSSTMSSPTSLPASATTNNSSPNGSGCSPNYSRTNIAHGRANHCEDPQLDHYNLADDADESPLLCAICRDRSSGLHYGIYTCEGNSGATTGGCPMSKEQRNRCQFCRFQKCLQQGMVLEAVREDRMPGGRNGSAIYNLYKLKYRKSRRMNTVCSRGSNPTPGCKIESTSTATAGEGCDETSSHQMHHEPSTSEQQATSSRMVTQNLDSSVDGPSNNGDGTTIHNTIETGSTESSCRNEKEEEGQNDHHNPNPVRKNLIQKLIDIDQLEKLINLNGLKIRNAEQIGAEKLSASQRLSHIGDEIVEQLVEWTKMLPFYNELPVEVHTHLLTQRWSELVLLSTCFFAYCMSSAVREPVGSIAAVQSIEEVSNVDASVNLRLLQKRLSAVMDKHIPLEHVTKEAGPLVDKFTALFYSFCRLKITLEAYVCLKAITILHYTPPNQENEDVNSKSSKMHTIYFRRVSIIQDQFVKALQIHLSQCENGPRLSEILTWLPMLHSASSVLLHSKMFYVPFLICHNPEAMPLVAGAITAPSTESDTNSNSDSSNGSGAVGVKAEEQHEETDTEEYEHINAGDSSKASSTAS